MRKNPKYPLRADERDKLFEEHKGICGRCGYSIDRVKEKWHVGHRVGRACGGDDEWANLRPEHSACNLTHAQKVENALAAKLKRIRHRHLGNRPETPWQKRYREMKEWKAKLDERE